MDDGNLVCLNSSHSLVYTSSADFVVASRPIDSKASKEVLVFSGLGMALATEGEEAEFQIDIVAPESGFPHQCGSYS